MRISGLSLVHANAVLKRTLLVVGASLCCFVGTTRTTQQDYREMKGMLSQYNWGISTRTTHSDRDIIKKRATDLVELDEVEVRVFLNEEASKLLDEQTLESLVKNRLRAMGIKVQDVSTGCLDSLLHNMNDYERLVCEDRNRSSICFSVEIGEGERLWYYTCSLVVRRGAYIRPGYYTIAIVWKRGAYGIIGKGIRQSEIREDFRNDLRDYLDQFEADWRLANDKN